MASSKSPEPARTARATGCASAAPARVRSGDTAFASVACLGDAAVGAEAGGCALPDALRARLGVATSDRMAAAAGTDGGRTDGGGTEAAGVRIGGVSAGAASAGSTCGIGEAASAGERSATTVCGASAAANALSITRTATKTPNAPAQAKPSAVSPSSPHRRSGRKAAVAATALGGGATCTIARVADGPGS